MTISLAPDSPISANLQATASTTNIMVFGVQLTLGQAVSCQVRRMAFTIDEMKTLPDGTATGITTLSLFVNPQGNGWADAATTLVVTKACSGTKTVFPNLAIDLTPPSTTIRFYLRIDGFNASDLWHGRQYTFSIGSNDVGVFKKKDANPQGSATSGTLDIDLQGIQAPVITSPADGTWTNDTTPTISGTATPSLMVKIYEGSTELGSTVATAQGAFSVDSSTLSEGTPHHHRRDPAKGEWLRNPETGSKNWPGVHPNER